MLEGHVHPWLLLTYKMPRDPSGGRVFVWRTLKQIGAILLHDSVWILPRLPWTRNRFEWLASEVGQLGGEATLWEARLEVGDRRRLIQQFLAQADAAYTHLLTELEAEDPDLDSISARFDEVK